MKLLKNIILFSVCSLITANGVTQNTDMDNKSSSKGIAEPGWEIVVTDNSNYTGVALSNGRIGLMPSAEPLMTDAIYLNNVFDKESPLGDTRLLKGINFTNLLFTIDGETVSTKNISGWKQVLNMKEAWLETSFNFDNKAQVTCRTYALRQMPYAALMDVTVKSLASKPVDVKVQGIIKCPAEYQIDTSAFRVLTDGEIKLPLLQTIARSQSGKHKLATSASFLFKGLTPELSHDNGGPGDNRLGFTERIEPGDTFSFGWAGAACTSKDFNDPQAESERMVIYLLRENTEKMIARHKQLWAELWEGDIIIEGDPESQQDVRLALYHLYAFSAAGSRLSVPPMGLSSQNYNGHIFWDSELWMYPPLLAFHPELASSMLDYRYDRLEKARQKARNFGYKGAMFPWESDDSGEEATPPWALTGTFEHHITADVGIAFWNYFRVTGDKQWLKETGFPVLKEVADFWVSRAEKNPDGSWSINNVVGANEYAPNVNDNAFTNGSAKAVLQYADKAAQVLGITPPESWKEVSDKLMFHYFENGVMKEHSEYTGDRIKQADVNLLTYPLEIVTSEEQARRDLEYYEPKIAAEGPAMGHSILSIIYSRLEDSKRSWELFKKSYEPNKRPPFGALSETAFLNNPYFCTGAGGMLQAVIFGFAGLHITENGIIQKTPCLPPHWKKLTIKGVQGRDYVAEH